MSEDTVNECRHPSSMRVFKREIINDKDINVEVCEKCGRSVIDPNEMNRFFSKRVEGDFLNSRDIILILLGVFADRPIINRIVLMKEVFLFEKELAKEINVNVDNQKFIPYDYGPYSRIVDDTLRDMVNKGIVKVEYRANRQKEVFILSEKGKMLIEVLFEQFGNSELELIKKRRKAWDQLGYYGILQKVYGEYPAYRSKSKIEEDIKPGRRWV